MATYRLMFGAQEVLHSVKCASLGDAQTLAQALATLLAVPIVLLPHAAPGGQVQYPDPTGPDAKGYAPAAQGSTVSCPSGVTAFAPPNS